MLLWLEEVRPFNIWNQFEFASPCLFFLFNYLILGRSHSGVDPPLPERSKQWNAVLSIKSEIERVSSADKECELGVICPIKNGSWEKVSSVDKEKGWERRTYNFLTVIRNVGTCSGTQLVKASLEFQIFSFEIFVQVRKDKIINWPVGYLTLDTFQKKPWICRVVRVLELSWKAVWV